MSKERVSKYFRKQQYDSLDKYQGYITVFITLVVS